MNTDKIYAEQLANEYAPKDTSKVVALRKLDARAKLPANVFTYTFGISRDLLPHNPANQERIGGTEMNFLELLICAKAGDNEAAERILTMYQPILVKESVLDGALDEDLYQSFVCSCFFAFGNSVFNHV